MPHSPCYGTHRRPLRAPPFAALAGWGRAFPPSVRVGSLHPASAYKRGMRGAVQKVCPPSSRPHPRSLEQDLGAGLPFEPRPIYARKGARRSAPQHPSPSFPLTHASEAPRPYPYPVCARRGRRDGPPRGRRGEGLHAPPCRAPSCHLALPPLCLRARQGHDREGEVGGGCAAMRQVRSLGGALPPSVPHPPSCANGECRAARKGTLLPRSRPLPHSCRSGLSAGPAPAGHAPVCV